MERLQKLLASRGVASRRASAMIIREGRVTVNGEVIREPGMRLNASTCEIKVDGRPIAGEDKKVYIILNKPQGYISTVHDPQGRPTILHLVPSFETRLFPVGRLDQDTEGLILLTNDGQVTNVLTHPRFGVRKTYVARVTGVPGEDDLNRLRDGVRLQSGHVSSPAVVRFIESAGNDAVVELEIGEGRKRQVREMFAVIGHPVKALTRTRLGQLSINGLPAGSWRYLTPSEERWIRKMASKSEKGVGRCKNM